MTERLSEEEKHEKQQLLREFEEAWQDAMTGNTMTEEEFREYVQSDDDDD